VERALLSPFAFGEDKQMRRIVFWFTVFMASLVAYFAFQRDAEAIPSFSRKYQTSCLTCHTVYPMLNAFGEAFRRDGYRMPSTKGSVDSDSIKAPMIPLGQEEYRKLFPESVIPDKIMEHVPLSIMLNGAVTMNFPDSDAKTGAGNVFAWNSLLGEFHLFAGGAFNDNFTYFAQLTIATDGIDIETGYLLWNDIIGPRHAVNLWIGRLMAPQLTSFGLHSSYLSDSMIPAVSIAGLYNPTGSFVVGQPHADGIELNGIIGHRFGYSVGWLASSQASALTTIDSEDVYAHIGIKSGGIALDGEGKYGPNPPDPMKPWAEKSLTLDLFAYHGMNLLDNGTGTVSGGTAVAVGQKNSVGVLGGALRGQLGSLIATAGLQFEHHDAPYQGTAATQASDGTITPGAPDLTHGDAWVQYNEVDYVLFPWLVPGIRTELTSMSLNPSGNSASSEHATLFRLIPGIAALVRPNIKIVLTGDFEYAYGMPVTGAWAPAGGSIIAPGPGQGSKIEAETLTATAAVAF
jgi:hypothetical protein